MGLEILLPLMIIVLIVMMIVQSSKQRKAMRTLREMQASLVRGDIVLTTSGLQATVADVGDETVDLEIAPGVRTRWDRRVIREKVDTASSSSTTNVAEDTGTSATDDGDPADKSGSRSDPSDQ